MLYGTGKTPSAFPQDRLRLDFRSSLEVGDALGAVLEGLLVGCLILLCMVKPFLHHTSFKHSHGVENSKEQI